MTRPDRQSGDDVPMDVIPPELLLDPYPEPHRAIANELRALVRKAVPEAIERVRPGWGLIGYDVPSGPRRTRYFAFVWPEPEHVHIGFEQGVLMDDPRGVLEGRGVTKQVRWLTFAPGSAVDAAVVLDLVREAARVALLSRPERLARLLDREGAPGSSP